MVQPIRNVRCDTRLLINASLLLLLSATIAIGQHDTRQANTLTPNQMLERRLKGGARHVYEIELNAGEYFHIDVEQQGIDVVLSLVSSNGKTLINRDRPIDETGFEALSFIATANGRYRLVVKALDKKAKTGKYTIKSDLPRHPTVEDQKRVDAESLFQTGIQLNLSKAMPSVAQACVKYEAAGKLYRELADKYAEALVQTSLGTCSESFDKNETAVAANERALQLYLELNDRPNEALSLSRLCIINALLQKPALAFVQCLQAKKIYQDLHDFNGEKDLTWRLSKVADYCHQSGFDLFKQGKASAYRDALGLFVTAREIYRELGETGHEADSLAAMARTTDELGEKQKALNYYEKEVLPLYKQARDDIGIATTLNNIGSVYDDLGHKQNALDYYEKQALPLYVKLRNERGIATTLNNIASVYDYLGENDKALDYYKNKVLPLFRKLGDQSGIGITLNNMGSVYDDLGEKQKALYYYEKLALPLFKKLKDKSRQAATLSNIGLVYESLGEKQKSLYYYEKKALPLCLVVGNKYIIATTLNNIGSAYSSLGDKQKALDYYENQALPLYKEIENKFGVATVFNNAGSVYDDLGQKQKALDYYENKALPLRRDLGSKSGIATTLNNIGLVYESLGQPEKALDYFEGQALPLLRAIGDKPREAVVLGNIMGIWNDLRNPRLAVLYGKQAVNALQQLRGTNQDLDKEFQKTYLKSVEGFYRYLVTLLLDQGRLVEAHQTLNAFKDQQYFDFSPETLKKPALLALTQRESEFNSRYAAASLKVSSLSRQLDELKLAIGRGDASPEDSARLQQLGSDLKIVEAELLTIIKRGQMEFSGPREALKDNQPDIEDTAKMQRALLQMGKPTVAIYTLVGNDSFRALVVTFDDILTVSSPIKGNKLNYKAKQLWAVLQSDKYEPKPLAKEIYDLIFKPITDKLIEKKKLEEILPEGATVMWSLDGNLRYLPISALNDGEKYFVERYNSVVFTRAETERWTQLANKNWTGVGFGNSLGSSVDYLGHVYRFEDLPNAAEELNSIFRTPTNHRGVFNGEVFQDRRFTRATMIAALKQHPRLVHISSHFKFSPGDEARSFLLLGDGSAFPLTDLKKHSKLFRGVDMLTLSACETAAQWANSDGREVDGFAELAQRLGAAAVMATLWNVRDDSSYWLLRDFYQRKRDQSGQTKAESLRRAQLALLTGTASVPASDTAGNIGARKGSGDSTAIKILPEGQDSPSQDEEGVVYVEAKNARAYNRIAARSYAHPYFWSPFVLFGNWR